MEEKVKNSLAKFVSYIFGAGLIAHAVYIYSLAYYQGYMLELGFPVELFPVDSSTIHIWSNTASRDITGNILISITSIGTTAIILSFVALLLALPLYNHLKPYWPNVVKKTKLEKQLEELQQLQKASNKTGFKKAIILTSIVIKRFEFGRAVLITQWGYLLMIPLLFIGIIWLYLPDMAIAQGKSFAQRHRANLESRLCGKPDDYWGRCFEFNLNHITNDPEPKLESDSGLDAAMSSSQKYIGRLITKNTEYIAIYTEEGPVVITSPAKLYLKPVRNPCYQNNECNTSVQLSALKNR